MKTLLALITVALLAGCGSPRVRTIRFESEPPGGRVFLTVGPNESAARGARNYLGSTPFAWTAEVKGDGTLKLDHSKIPIYSDFVQAVAVFTCEPPSGGTNLFTKREIYHSSAEFQPGNKTPEGIFFDLTKP